MSMVPPKVGVLEAVIGGETVELSPEKALFHPSSQTLFVADLHLGKNAAFAAAGIPVPQGVTDDDLARLSMVLDATGANQLVILGDLLHARTSRSQDVFHSLATWRARHVGCAIVLVRGNHDRAAGDPPAFLEIKSVSPPHAVGPFLCFHELPEATEVDGYALGGHIHPAVALGGRAGGRIKLPCFWFGLDRGLLPAFGSFTGTAIVKPRRNEQVVVVTPDGLIRVVTDRDRSEPDRLTIRRSRIR